MVKTNTLVQIGTIGGISVAGFGYYVLGKVRRNVTEAPYYVDALTILKQHKGAIHYMGEPIEDKVFDYNNDNNFCDGKNAYFEIPVRGPTGVGTYYFWAEKNDNKWEITKSELGLQRDLTRRLIIQKIKS